MKPILTAILLLGVSQPLLALDPACDPLIRSSEAKIAQPAWHSVVTSDGVSIEAMKAGGQFFTKMDGQWIPSPMDLDEAERAAVTMMQEGRLRITDCASGGGETLDGREVEILTYTTSMPGSGLPPSLARLYIGAADGLPYKVVDQGPEGTTVTYRYTDVVAPEL